MNLLHCGFHSALHSQLFQLIQAVLGTGATAEGRVESVLPVPVHQLPADLAADERGLPVGHVLGLSPGHALHHDQEQGTHTGNIL